MTTVIGAIATAQAQGDECAQAFRIPTPRNYCSGATQFTTEGATRGTISDDCGTDSRSPDVWFSFVAAEAGINITVITEGTATLRGAKFSVYSGNCAQPREVAPCGGAGVNASRVSASPTTLTPGQTYFIRVYADRVATGTFQLCMRSFDPSLNTSSDCGDARVLCGDPQSVVVPELTGAGRVTNEIPFSSCLQGVESNSTWLKFGVDQAGVVEFTLTPPEPSTDLDFAVFRLRNGLSDCSNKEILRCGAAGGGGCEGATGLRIGSNDQVEGSGCEMGQDKFVAALDVRAGEVYAIVVNNYSGNGTGFQLDWGRTTAVFAGPDATFTSQIMSSDCSSTVVDFSAPAGSGLSYAWDFGAGANPATSTEGAPRVTFTGDPGPRSVVLTVTSGDCSATTQRTIEISPGALAEPVIVVALLGDGCANQAFSFRVEAPVTGLVYTWDFGADAAPATATGAGPIQVVYAGAGATTVSVTGSLGTNPNCSAGSTVTVGYAPEPAFTIEVRNVRDVDCSGPNTGSFEVSIAETGDYLLSINGGQAQLSGRFEGLAAGSYQLRAIPAGAPAACAKTQSVTIGPPPAPPVFTTRTTTPETCPGLLDGSIVATGPTGATFALDGATPQTSGSFSALATGTYALTLTASNGCSSTDSVTVGAGASPFTGTATATPAACSAAADGTITLPSGADRYTIDGLPEQASPTFGGLAPGSYAWRIQTTIGCALEGRIDVPAAEVPFTIGGIAVTPASCNEARNGGITVGPRPGLTYDFEGAPLDTAVPVDSLAAGDYQLRATDARGCQVDTVLQVSAGLGPVFDLGPDRVVGFRDTVVLAAPLDASLGTIVGYRWTGFATGDSTATATGDTVATTPTLSFVPRATPLLVTLTLTDANGCMSSDALLVTVRISSRLGLPTAFSPNGDDVNDRFTIYAQEDVRVVRRLEVYDRWGGLRYALGNFPASDPRFGWDGSCGDEPCDTGVYAFRAEVEFVDGSVRTVSGAVTLMR